MRVHVSERVFIVRTGEASGIEPSSWREHYVPACDIDRRRRVCGTSQKKEKIVVIVMEHC